jgi:hypothetical protein
MNRDNRTDILTLLIHKSKSPETTSTKTKEAGLQNNERPASYT